MHHFTQSSHVHIRTSQLRTASRSPVTYRYASLNHVLHLSITHCFTSHRYTFPSRAPLHISQSPTALRVSVTHRLHCFQSHTVTSFLVTRRFPSPSHAPPHVYRSRTASRPPITHRFTVRTHVCVCVCGQDTRDAREHHDQAGAAPGQHAQPRAGPGPL